MTPTRPPSPLLLYLGLALATLGFVLIAFTWGRVAGLDSVALQLPYVVSGGLTGLGLLIIGATAVNIHAKRREGADRDRQAQQLLEILERLAALTDPSPGPASAAPQQQEVSPANPDGQTTATNSPSDISRELAWDR